MENNSRNSVLLPSFYGKLNKVSDGIINVKGDKIIYTFNFHNFLFKEYFVDLITKRLYFDRSYYVLIKIRHNDELYKMAGKQFIFTFDNNVNNTLDQLYDLVVKRIQNLMDEYQIQDSDLVYIQLIFTPFDKRVLSDIKFNQNFDFKGQPISLKKDILYFPLSNNESDLGIKLFVEYHDNYVLLYKGKYDNYDVFTIKIPKKGIILDTNTNFYLRDITNPNYIIAVLVKNNSIIKQAYDLKGNLLQEITDNINNNIIVRDTKSFSIKIKSEENKILSKFKILDLKPISNKIKKSSNLIEDSKIGVIDLEVYKNLELDKEFVYSAGLFSRYVENIPKLFYINDKLNSDKVILDLIDEMFRSKYSGITW